MAQFLWKIGGEAGFGIMVTGLSFAKIASKQGYHVFDYAEYPSLIRGGHNTYEVIVSDDEVHMSKQEVDLLVCLNKATYDLHKHRLTPKSMVIYDPDEFDLQGDVVKIAIPFKKFRKEYKLMQVLVNSVALAASLALLGVDISVLHAAIEKEFAKKSKEVIDFNKQLACVGYEYIEEHYKNLIQPVLTKRTAKEKIVLCGNEAFSFGAVVADCRLFAAYPMTPTSNVLTIMADWQEKVGHIARHSEDEVAVINSALGAAFAGVRTSVATSGGGFALMVEAISFAGVAELPIVIFLGQRPGPATGMPSWTEQGDLLFACHAGHGEFPKIVLTPGDPYEMIELSVKAFDMADVYQTPVIVVGDKLLCESHMSHSKDEVLSFLANYSPNYGKKVDQVASGYQRYQLEVDGISPRLVPGQPGVFYQANSYEHSEDSHTTEESEPRIEQVDKRNRKTHTYLEHHFMPPKVYGNLQESDTVLVSWGTNKGAILEAQKKLHSAGTTVAYVHFTHVYPMDKEKVLPFFKSGKRYIMIENNSHAQFAQLLRMQTGITVAEHLLKYDGRPFYPEEIVNYLS